MEKLKSTLETRLVNMQPKTTSKNNQETPKPEIESYFNGSIVLDWQWAEGQFASKWLPDVKVNDKDLITKHILSQLKDLVPKVYKDDLTYEWGLYKRLVSGESFIIKGDVGRGKTLTLYKLLASYIAVVTLSQVKDKLKTLHSGLDDEKLLKVETLPKRIYNVVNLINDLKKEFDNKPVKSLLDRMIESEILFLDDLGTENKTDWWMEQLYMLINSRYESGKSIVITTNLTGEDLASFYGSRIVSRLTQMCSVLNVNGPDHRLLKAKKKNETKI